MTDNITKLIGEMAEQVAENNLAEISYEKGDVKVKVVGQQPQPVQQPELIQEVVTQPQQPTITEDFITSPMVGVVYLQSDPDKPPYVKPGDEVNEDTIVCIIEAMKTFNSIRADKCGKIRKVLVRNGDPVEYGMPLFSVIYE